MRHVTHEWVGEPHESESIKYVDGVEVARNLVPNPRANDPAQWGSLTPGGAEHNQRFVAGSGPLGMSYVRTTVTEPGFTGTYVRARTEYFPVTDGSHVAISAYIRSVRSPSKTGRVTITQNLDASYVDHVMTSTVPVTGNWERVTGTRVWGEGVSGVGLLSLDLYRSSGLEAGDFVDVSGVMLATADTEAEALAQVETYFDGDTEDYYLMPMFKVWANGAWHPIAPRAYVGGGFKG